MDLLSREVTRRPIGQSAQVTRRHGRDHPDEGAALSTLVSNVAKAVEKAELAERR
jgi:hypothetical protein